MAVGLAVARWAAAPAAAVPTDQGSPDGHGIRMMDISAPVSSAT